jgi:uncharacterized protein (DUF849 family)
MSKVIITCAATGAIHTPSMSPHLPVTPQDIMDSSGGWAQAWQILQLKGAEQARF